MTAATGRQIDAGRPIGLYPRLLGPAWLELHPAIRRIHLTDAVARGRFAFRHGRSITARLTCWALVLTMADFVTEIAVRRSLGNVYGGERVTHAVMGIVYGAMIAMLLPALSTWWQQPTALRLAPAGVPAALRCALGVMAAGVFVSGVRDLCAAARLPYADWPWTMGRAG
jgi:hypothetical protein